MSALPQLAAPRLDTEERGINTPFQSTGRGGVQSVSAFFARPTVLVVIALLAGALAVLFVPDFHIGGNAGGQAVSSASVAANPEMPASSDGVAMGVSSVASDTPPASASASAAPLPETAPAAAVTTAAAPAAVATTVATASVAPVAPFAPASALSATRAAAVLAPNAAASAVAAARPASAVVANSGTGILVFRAKEPTWVEVSDARKVVLIRRTLANGETVGFSGELPLSVVVGKVDGVAVEVRGQPLTMEPLAGTNVARFEVK